MLNNTVGGGPLFSYSRVRLQWPCNTSSENSSKSKINTATGKTVLKLVKNPKFPLAPLSLKVTVPNQ
jgi:hypothetical protein